MYFKKGLGDNVKPEIMTQAWIDALLPCDIVNPFAMNDPRVLIQEPLMEIPQLGTPEFDLEIVNVARAVHLSKQKSKFDGEESGGWEWLTSKHSGKFVCDCIEKKYRIKRADELAELVHNDFPTQLMDDLFRYMKSKGAKIDKSLFNEKPYKVFTDGVVMVERVIGQLVHDISPTAFAHKYFHWRARPEEVIGAWVRGEISFDPMVEEALNHYVDIEDVLFDERKFTTYPEGCPNHPALPAMHSAVASMALFISVILDLTPQQESECIKMAANIAFGRTFAGVHYRLDNLYGLELGERCAEIILPDLLVPYGGIKELVQAKIALKRNHWI